MMAYKSFICNVFWGLLSCQLYLSNMVMLLGFVPPAFLFINFFGIRFIVYLMPLLSQFVFAIALLPPRFLDLWFWHLFVIEIWSYSICLSLNSGICLCWFSVYRVLKAHVVLSRVHIRTVADCFILISSWILTCCALSHAEMEWNAIPQGNMQTLIHSMSRRMQAIIAARGGNAHH